MPETKCQDVKVRGVPVGLWWRVRVAAVRQGITLREAVIAALEAYLRQVKPPANQ